MADLADNKTLVTGTQERTRHMIPEEKCLDAIHSEFYTLFPEIDR